MRPILTIRMHGRRRKKAEALEQGPKKRGRPKQYGQKSIWMLHRATLVVYAYDRARASGAKHWAAIVEALNHVREKNPRMPISESEVRRILAEWRPSGTSEGLSVSPPDPADSTITLGGKVFRVVLVAAWGPRPVYPRVNAV